MTTLDSPLPPGERPRRWIAALFLEPGCDMACTFCGSESSFARMTPRQARELLEAVRGHGCTHVILGGGEPTRWPHDLGALARFARDLGLHVQLGTHGGGLETRLDELAAVDRFILPLESMDPRVHDRLRQGGAPHHDRVLSTLETVLARGSEVTISTVVTSWNLDSVEGVGHFLAGVNRRHRRIHAWHLYRFLPIGRRGRRHAPVLAVPLDAFRRIARQARRLGDEAGLTVYRRDCMTASRSVEFYWIESGRVVRGSDRVGDRLRPTHGVIRRTWPVEIS